MHMHNKVNRVLYLDPDVATTTYDPSKMKRLDWMKTEVVVIFNCMII